VVGLDITTGLPRVEELFEARVPKNPATISEISGVAEVTQVDDGQTIKISSSELLRDEHQLPKGWKVMVKNRQQIEMGTVLASPPAATKKSKSKDAKETRAVTSPDENKAVISPMAGTVIIEAGKLSVAYEERDERTYHVSPATRLRVQSGEKVTAGQQITEGQLNPQDKLNISGKEAVQRYLVDEVLKVYRSQGVTINDKHIETIVRQMLSKVRADSSGDTELVPGELVNRFQYEDINAKVLAEGGEPATAHPVLLGITRAALSTSSWLAAASFQETTKILTEASIKRATDHLIGLKENVIIGRLIPARYKPLSEMVSAPVATLEEVLEKLDEGAGSGLDEDIKGENPVVATGRDTDVEPDNANT
jgi:DNA-directed RNA polymerase subunit beta'